MRLIDGDKLKRKAQKVATEAWKMRMTANIETILNQFIDWIDDMPTVDAVPVRHSSWMPMFDGAFKGGAYWFHCGICGRTVPGGLQSGYNFCPECGARMDGGQHE